MVLPGPIPSNIPQHWVTSRDVTSAHFSLGTEGKWGTESWGDLTEVLKKGSVRARTIFSSLFLIQVNDRLWNLPLCLPNFLFRPQRGTGCASSLWMLNLAIWACWNPHLGSCWHSTEQSEAPNPFAPSPRHKHHPLQGSLWVFGANLGRNTILKATPRRL